MDCSIQYTSTEFSWCGSGGRGKENRSRCSSSARGHHAVRRQSSCPRGSTGPDRAVKLRRTSSNPTLCSKEEQSPGLGGWSPWFVEDTDDQRGQVPHPTTHRASVLGWLPSPTIFGQLCLCCLFGNVFMSLKFLVSEPTELFERKLVEHQGFLTTT